jgi:hypothetical protein
MSENKPGSGWWQATDGKWYAQQWEYTYRFHSGNDMENDLHRDAQYLGLKGWELVNIAYPHMRSNITAWFKRPIGSESE